MDLRKAYIPLIFGLALSITGCGYRPAVKAKHPYIKETKAPAIRTALGCEVNLQSVQKNENGLIIMKMVTKGPKNSGSYLQEEIYANIEVAPPAQLVVYKEHKKLKDNSYLVSFGCRAPNSVHHVSVFKHINTVSSVNSEFHVPITIGNKNHATQYVDGISIKVIDASVLPTGTRECRTSSPVLHIEFGLGEDSLPDEVILTDKNGKVYKNLYYSYCRTCETLFAIPKSKRPKEFILKVKAITPKWDSDVVVFENIPV